MDDAITRRVRRYQRGVTLVELLIGLVVISITLMAAAPTFQGMIERNRVATQVNEFMVAVNVARSEASRTGSVVSVQAVDASAANEFGGGFCVVMGNPGDCDGTAIRRFDATPASMTLDSIEDVASIQFSPLGALSGTGGLPRQFDLCSDSVNGRRIVVSPIGRSKSHAPDDPDENRQPEC